MPPMVCGLSITPNLAALHLSLKGFLGIVDHYRIYLGSDFYLGYNLMGFWKN